MRLVRFRVEGREGLGIRHDDLVYDLSPYVPDIVALAQLSASHNGVEVLKAWTEDAAAYRSQQVTLLAPVAADSRIFCASLNYETHAREAGRALHLEPYLFSKLRSAVIDPGSDISYPLVTQHLDYEGELVVVIGRSGRNIDVSEALKHILGFTIMNDTTARDLQKSGGKENAVNDWLSAKSLDGTTPIGPEIVTTDELSNLEEMVIETRVNGELRQTGSAGDMVFPVERLIAFLSARVELRPMDLIATGTPGRKLGYRTMPLADGDIVAVSISGIGELTNVVRREVSVG